MHTTEKRLFVWSTDMTFSNVLVHLQVVDHYENPRNVGSFGKSDADVGTGLVGAPACGDVMKLQIKASQSTLGSGYVLPAFACREPSMQVEVRPLHGQP